MSKMGQAVFEGEEFAQNHFGEKAHDFNRMALDAFGGHSVQYEAAIAEYLEYTNLKSMEDCE